VAEPGIRELIEDCERPYVLGQAFIFIAEVVGIEA
jgi:hypothetical protein